MNEILIYGDIWGETASYVAAELRALASDDPVVVRINSPGGDVFAGKAIVNSLRSHPGEVTAVVEGMAASTASFIAVGGAQRLVMRPGAELMIHSAWSGGAGESKDFRKQADNLDRATEYMAQVYADKSGKPVDEWMNVMAEDKWFSADDAVAVGLADAVEDGRVGGMSALAGSTVMAQLANRRPQGSKLLHQSKPLEGGKGADMAFLEDLEKATGLTQDEIKAKMVELFSLKAEQIAEVPAVITVSYPDEATVVPTGRTTVEPTSEVPEGLTFSVTGMTEGWTAEVNETTGIVAVVSADGSRIGDVGEVTLTVVGSGGEAEFTLVVKVVSADQKADEGNQGDPIVEPGTSSDPLTGPGPDDVVIPRALFDEYAKAYALNGEQMAELAKRDREKEVDSWIAKGKFPAGLRAKALVALEKDPDSARRVWGALPDGKIPRKEKGYTKAEVKDAGNPVSKEEKVAALKARANELAKSK